VRLFLAINLPMDVQRDVARATEDLRAAVPQVSWIREPLIHMTLKFLGEQLDEMVDRFEPVLAGIASRHRELVMDLHQVGAFPNLRRPRVVWMGIAPEARLELLHHDVEVVCEELGFELEGRAFHPHVTLARVKRPLDQPATRTLARAAKAVDFRADVVVRSIDLMRSELLPTGPRYTTLVSAPFRSG